MSVVEPSSLGRLVGPHLAKARARDTMLNMLLSESPPESPAVSDDEDDEFEIRPQRQVTIAADVAAPPLSQPAQSAAGQQPAQKPPPHGGDHAPLQRPARIQFRPAPAADGADPGTTSVHVFTREEPPQVPEGTSTLTALLQRTSTVANAANKASASAPHVKLRIFNAPPDGRMMALEAPESATLIDVIRMVLAQGGGEEATGPSSAYELLFVDADGDADDDIIPPRAKPFVDFGRDFYLRRASAKKAAAYAQSDPPDDGGGGGGGAATRSSRPLRARRAPASRRMRVHLPREAFGQRLGQWVIKQPYRPDATLAELMGEVCRLQRVRLHPRHHVFALPGGGAALDMMRKLKEVDLPRSDAGEPEIRLVPRAYVDEAPGKHAQALSGSGGGHQATAAADGYGYGYGGGGGDGGSYDDPYAPGDGFGGGGGGKSVDSAAETAAKMQELDHTLVSGAMLYQEYAVVKVNKRGVRQTRVIGLDNHKFRNMAPANAREDDAGPTSLRDGALKWFGVRANSSGTKHPFHYMTDLADAWLDSAAGPRSFCVVFREPDTSGSDHRPRRKEHRYEAETPTEAAEIVRKLNHVASLVSGATRTERIRDDPMPIR